MRVLFTGGSSFTGTWFVRALAAVGHEVVTVFRRSEDEYEGVRGERVRLLAGVCDRRFGISFGDDAFLALVAKERFDVLCHHAALVEGYNESRFDVLGAVAANGRNIREVTEALASRGCSRLVLTGTFSEPGESIGERPLRAFNEYSLSKSLTASMVAYYADRAGLAFAKLVCPNPFGPYEDVRFTSYLVRMWREGAVPTVRTPAYVRDNAHVDVLAEAYAGFVEDGRATYLAPSGYVETQGAFAARFADAIGARLGLACPLELAVQTEFPEPVVRVNESPLRLLVPGWDESASWDALASYYERSVPVAD